MDGVKGILVVLVIVTITAVSFYFVNRAKVTADEKVDLMDGVADELMEGLEW